MVTKEITRAVIRTLCAYAQYACAPTPMELWARCIGCPQGVNISNVEEAIDELVDKGVIVRKDGCVALGSCTSFIEQRNAFVQVEFAKWRILKRAVRLLRVVPFLRMVAVTNTVAMNAADEASDIDVLIIGHHGRLWSVRFFVATILQIAGLRRHGQHIHNRICLSFFLSDRHWSLEPFARGDDPLYAFCWVSFTTVVFAPELEVAREAFAHHNTWVKNYLPHHEWKVLNDIRAVRDSRWSRAVRAALEWAFGGRFGDGLERLLRAYQYRRIMSNPASRVHHGGVDVVVNDDVLKFHESDARSEIHAHWEYQVEEVIAEAGL